MSTALHCTAFVLCVLILACAAARVVRRREPVARKSAAGAAAWLAALVAFAAYDAAGMVRCDKPWPAPLALVLLAGAAALSLAGPSLRDRLRAPLAALRPLVAVACVPLALFLLEWPYNGLLFEMEGPYVRLNLQLVGAALLAFWFVCQRRTGALVAFLAASLGVGLANYFVCLFKGQTILPADVLALSTAAEVGANYSFVAGDSAVEAVCAFVAAAALVSLFPSPRLTRVRVAFNLVVGLALASSLVAWYQDTDIRERYDVSVDVFFTRESYEEYGTVPSFLQRMQEVEPEVPAGYSAEAALSVQSELAAAWDEAHPDYPATLEDAAQAQLEATGSEELPTVVAIMNESFSDLSRYPGVEGYGGTLAFGGIEAFERGSLYVSARGGGTCNTEFEYLTGSSLGIMGGGVYPYMFYDLGLAESLPRYFSALGYATTAVHPENPANWRRDVVYGRMGFDRFLSEDDFPGDADTLRGMVTDRETYDLILDLLERGDAPQFVFDVTLQNHGGYETGLLDSYPHDGVTVRGERIEGMSEYLSCVDASEEDLLYFLERLEGLDRKVVVVFFGDHQPGFNDALAEASYGSAVGDLGIAEGQSRFETPYLVWANYDIESVADLVGGSSDEGEAASTDEGSNDALSVDAGDVSVGYLMAKTAYAAGLPLTDYQKALLQLSEEIPVLNLNGYCDAAGRWYRIGEESEASEAFSAYELIQHANIFDAAGNPSAFAAFADRVAQTGE